MLSVSSMALAAMLGSACGTNMANLNDYNAARQNTSNCPQAIQYQNGGQDLDSILSQMGASVQPGGSQCGINPGCIGGNCVNNTCQGSSCSTGSCAGGSYGMGF